jgi:hypothetical protein
MKFGEVIQKKAANDKNSGKRTAQTDPHSPRQIPRSPFPNHRQINSENFYSLFGISNLLTLQSRR